MTYLFKKKTVRPKAFVLKFGADEEIQKLIRDKKSNSTDMATNNTIQYLLRLPTGAFRCNCLKLQYIRL